MSGIAGIIRFDGAPVEPGLVQRMTAAMDYRGPDGIAHWAKGPVALGQCMLCTTPESLEETQPLCNEDESLVLVMDGRVDNWAELRQELLARGAVLRTRADAELVLRAYEAWGKECLAHMDGDFALVLWDAKQQQAFCARDRMGIKPLHYHWSNGVLVFASDLHAILAMPWVAQVPNRGMLAEFLATEWYSRDETLWTGVMRLVAAHCMPVDANGPRPAQYWAPDVYATLPYTTDEEYAEHYRELLFDTVRRQSRSHRPVAFEVSGGLDSSALFCIAEHLRRSSQLPAPGIEGYTLAFTDDSAAAELPYAHAVADYLGLTIHEVEPTLEPLAFYAERARVLRNFPGFPNADMANNLLRQAALKSRVIVTGEGGDAWLQGSRSHYAESLVRGDWAHALQGYRSDRSVYGTRRAMKLLARYGVFPLLPAALQQGLRGMRGVAPAVREPLSRAMLATLKERRARYPQRRDTAVHGRSQRELLATLNDAFTAHILERLELRNALAGLEIRHPMYDYRFVQFAFATPARLRVQGSVRKVIHRQALAQHMPRAILERNTKAEFSSVFRAKLDTMKEVLTQEIPRRHSDWANAEEMSALYEAYQGMQQVGRIEWTLWSIYACDLVFTT